MYIYQAEVGYDFKYVEDKNKTNYSNNRHFNVAAMNVEEAIEKGKKLLAESN